MNRKIISWLLSLVVTASLFLSLPASACGCGTLLTSSDDGWSYGDDSVENSLINFENGTEKLIIGLNLKKRSKDAVLVIPIPSDPRAVKADVLSEIPRFSGYNISERARENLANIRDALLSTQIYPIVPIFLKNFIMGSGVGGMADDAMLTNVLGVPASKGQDIVVYQHLEKEGMVAEVLSAATSDALYEYLTRKGLRVEKDSIPIFRDYIKNEFSFVVSWIGASAAAQSAKGLQMNFPAREIYYPLKPGSVYSGPGMDKVITVAGYVSPKLYPDIESATKVDYFYSDAKPSFKNFYTADKKFGYTRIVVKAAPKKLTQDLYISNKAPLKIVSAQFINLHPFVFGFILLIVLSFISTFFASRAILFRSPQSPINVVSLSIANCFTLIGTIIGSYFFLKEKRFKFIVSFSLIFVVFALVVPFLISLLYK